MGDNIKSTVLDDKPNQVKIGIDAPGDVEVWRDRIYAKIREHDRK
ncbi:MAG: carbon storage regulator [Planctomycetota bacterium]